MEAITARLEQLQEIENTMHSDRISVIARRKEEDNEIQSRRLQEDEEWNNQMKARDREEDVLLLRKRELSRLSMSWTPAVKSSPSEHAINELDEPLEATASRLGNEEHDPATLAQLHSSTRKRGNKRIVKQYKTNQGFPQTNDALGPLFLRQSDNQLVHLHCCVKGCNKAYFGTVTSLMNHIASSRHHGFGKGFLKDHADAIEKCGRAPGSDEEFVEVPPRDTVKRTSSGSRGYTLRATVTSDNVIPTSSLVRVNRKGRFNSININESTNGFPPRERFRSITGMRLLRLEEETESAFISANGIIDEDTASNGLSPNPTAATTATETLLPDMGVAVQIKQEEQNYTEAPAAMWIDTIPASVMSMPAQHAEELVRHERAVTTCPERNLPSSPRVRKRHASTGPSDYRHVIKKFC